VRRLAHAAMMHKQICERVHEIKPQTCTELLGLATPLGSGVMTAILQC
jgi:hypothetical protein